MDYEWHCSVSAARNSLTDLRWEIGLSPYREGHMNDEVGRASRELRRSQSPSADDVCVC